MTVKEIFDLRKQGKIEEAYEAIRPMYAAHKGRYTTLCMFWTAADVFKLRLEQKRVDEAEKILEALKRMLPRIEEITKELDKQRDQKGKASSTAETKDVVAKKADENLPWESNKPQHQVNSAAAFLRSAEHRLASTVPAGSPAVSPIATVLAASPSSSSSLHFSCESALALSGSPASSVFSGSPASSELSGSPSVSVLSGSPAENTALSDSVAEGLNPSQQAVLDCIATHPGLRVPKLSELTNIPSKSIERHISALIDHGLIEHQGSKKTGGYYVK